MPNRISSLICWDWNEPVPIDNIIGILESLGISVYEDPTMDGSTCYSYIFSNEKLTADEIRNISKKYHGIDSEDD